MRIPTAVDALAEQYLTDYTALDPVFATYLGVPGHETELPDLSPDGREQVSALRRRTLAARDATEPRDETDRVTVAALREELGVQEDIRAAGDEQLLLNNIDSPVQNLRMVFDLMRTETADDWAAAAARLARVPEAIDGYLASLRAAAADGRVAARRQVHAAVQQCDEVTGADGFFAQFARAASLGDGELPESVGRALAVGAQAAVEGYRRLRDYLAGELLTKAPERDAVGREKYALYSRAFLGARVDLDETYAWGQDELARITADMARTADRIEPGTTVREAMARLDADADRKLAGTDALRAWMQEKSDAAVAALAGTHFDIPEPIRRLECLIAPTRTGGIYYTQPSEDLSRPGRMWWSVPPDVTEFGTWRELTTVYHEGVPGHHLQIAQTVLRKDVLNRWRRTASWVSGHGEGWALYAERLMADLGFLDDPADYLGMLDSQSLRAARVVLDIGIHCELPPPAEAGGGAWNWDTAWAFLDAHCSKAEGFRRFELERYLGWPGQAPSYKIGERLWLQLRDDARAREGDAFDLAAFHRRALDVGSVGLDALRAAVLG
jgi:uncharacterized protein (DUF885 family)